MNKKMVLTLFSSDSSQQYKKDVLNVIAAPYNSEYRFRYKKEYIEENVESYLSDKSANNKRAIIVYRTNSDKSEVDPFMVPVRWCKIKKIDWEKKQYKRIYTSSEKFTFMGICTCAGRGLFYFGSPYVSITDCKQ